jgi:hypothetical protein
MHTTSPASSAHPGTAAAPHAIRGSQQKYATAHIAAVIPNPIASVLVPGRLAGTDIARRPSAQ